jgi:hypothetical protein
MLVFGGVGLLASMLLMAVARSPRLTTAGKLVGGLLTLAIATGILVGVYLRTLGGL